MEDQPTLFYDHGDKEKPSPSLPSSIGPYRILSVLGEGGMGVVYLAQQEQPVLRKVALKVVRNGMENDLVFARFERERHALARMNHPHIASVYNAGSTEDGFPYFVMEYVEGTTITKHCDHYQLSLEQRLALFVQVCDAVAHAHRRMVIHRDLKPSNILVAHNDGVAMPKVIDFGVARFTTVEAEQSGLTSAGMPVGTPAYLAPEQIEGNPDDLDSRVDVYSLGVVLYELLCGSRPFDDSGNMIQVFTRILSHDVQTPSTRLTAGNTEIGVIAAQRDVEEKMLARKLKGDLDWIVMKAIARDRDQRYLDVAQLRDDIRRYEQNHPVHAKPPSAGYRLKKFVSRHKAMVTGAVGVLIALVFGILGTTSAMLEAQAAKREAQEAEHTARVTVEYLRDILSSADPTQDGRQVKVADLLDHASQMLNQDLEDRPEIEAPLRKTLGWTYLELGLYERAEVQLIVALELQRQLLGDVHLETLNTQNALGRVYYKKGRYADAEALHRKAYEHEKMKQGIEHPSTLWTMYNLAKSLDKQGHLREAEELYRLNVKTRTKVLGSAHPHTLISQNSLGLLLSSMGRYREAEVLLLSNLEALRQASGESHPNTLNAIANLTTVKNRNKKYSEALALASSVHKKQTEVFGAEHPETLESLNQKAYALRHLGRCDEAHQINTELLTLRKNSLGQNHVQTQLTLLELASSLCCMDDHKLANSLFEQAFHAPQKDQWGGKAQIVEYSLAFGSCLLHESRPKTALVQLQQAYRLLGSRALGNPELLSNLAKAHEALGDHRRAKEIRALIQSEHGTQ